MLLLIFRQPGPSSDSAMQSVHTSIGGNNPVNVMIHSPRWEPGHVISGSSGVNLELQRDLKKKKKQCQQQSFDSHGPYLCILVV